MKILSLIKYRDFLGESINFSINNQSSFQTVAGGFLSISIYIAYIYFFYYFGLDFIFKQNPNVYSQMKSLESETVPKINLTADDFIFGIRFEDYDGNAVDYEEYSYAKIMYYNYTLNKTNGLFSGGEHELEMTSCDQFPKIKEKIPNSVFNLSTYKCPNISKYKNSVDLGGYWEENQISFFTFELNYCKDEQKKICINPQKLANKSLANKEFYINVVYLEVIFNADNYTKPFEYKFKYHFSIFSPSTVFRDLLFLGYNHLNEDAGIIFDSSEEKMELGGLRLRSSNRNNDNSVMKDNSMFNIFYTLQIFFGREYAYHTRKYMKLQDLLGNVSGFMELVLLIISFLYKVYNKFRLDTYLFNRLVYIKEYKAGDSTTNCLNSNFNLDNGSKPVQMCDLNDKAAFRGRIDEIICQNKNKNKENADVQNHYVNTSGVLKSLNLQIPKTKEIFNSSKAKGIDQSNNRSESISEANNVSTYRMLKIIDKKKEIKPEPEDCCPQMIPKASDINDNTVTNKTTKKTIDKLNLIKIFKNIKKKKNGILFSMLDYFADALRIINKKKKEKFDLLKKLEKYSEKIYALFDIFNYLKWFKSLQYLKKLFLEKEELLILNKISEKSYAVEINLNPMTKLKETDKRYKKDDEFLIETFLNSDSLLNKKMVSLISSLD